MDCSCGKHCYCMEFDFTTDYIPLSSTRGTMITTCLLYTILIYIMYGYSLADTHTQRVSDCECLAGERDYVVRLRTWRGSGNCRRCVVVGSTNNGDNPVSSQ